MGAKMINIIIELLRPLIIAWLTKKIEKLQKKIDKAQKKLDSKIEKAGLTQTEEDW
jgi:predicted Holliday junction resolvase-like endonuclease